MATRPGALFGGMDGGDTWASLGIQVAEVANMQAVHVGAARRDGRSSGQPESGRRGRARRSLGPVTRSRAA